MLRGIICAVAVLGCLILGPLLWLRSGMGGLAGALVWVWAVIMIYLVGLIILRVKRGLGSEEVRFHTQMAQFLAQAEDPETAHTEARGERPAMEDKPAPR
ncbi:MAG: hypothetical protein WBG37_00120 [Desulfobacterales bacterium]